MTIAVFPGSFDPVTLGHMDILKRASRLFDQVYVCAMVNAGKHPMFTAQQRWELLTAATAGLANVTAEQWSGLLADYAKQKEAHYLVKGVRNGTDFDAEYGMAQINRGLDETLETVFLPAHPEFAHYSSSMVREMIKYRQPLERYVPLETIGRMKGWVYNGEYEC